MTYLCLRMTAVPPRHRVFVPVLFRLLQPSIICFGPVLAAIFALPGRITVRTPKICGGFVWTLFGNSTYEEGVLYALVKERDVKGWAHAHIGNSD